MSPLLYTTVLGFLSKASKVVFLPDYEAYHEATGFTDECYYGTEAENVCHSQGFCSTNSVGQDASCDCTYGWGGEFCTEDTILDLCGEMFCYNRGQCVVGVNGTSGASCFCETGFSGDNCEIEDEIADVCDGVMCSGNGQCVATEGQTTEWACECHVGFSGLNCGETLDYCAAVFMMDIFVRLAFTSGNLNATQECGYATPTIFEDTHPAVYDDETFSYCVCADVWSEYGYDDYENQLANCVMDMYRPLTFMEETEAYCPFCDDTQDAVMESLITSKSDTCYHFIYERETMALYWRTMWKCFCMYSIGTPSTIETIVTCPFTKHSSKNDYISWENCKYDRMCQWKDMYKYFEEEYSQIDLTGSQLCKEWMEEWIFVTPDDHVLLEDMTTWMCPCLEALRGHCDGCDHALNCVPVTFHQLTMLEAFDMLCNDDKLDKRDCLNYIGYMAIELGTNNFTASTMCYSAIDLGYKLDHMTANLKGLMCGCLGPAVTLLSDDSYQTDNFDLALSCISDEFSMDLADCPSDLYDGDSYWIPVTTDYEMEAAIAEADVKMEQVEDDSNFKVHDDSIVGSEAFGTGGQPTSRHIQFTTDYWTSSSVWKSITIGEFVALMVLSGTAFGLNKKKIKMQRN